MFIDVRNFQQVFKKIKQFSGSVICFYFPVHKKKKKKKRFTGLSNIYTIFFLSPVSICLAGPLLLPVIFFLSGKPTYTMITASLEYIFINSFQCEHKGRNQGIDEVGEFKI